MDQLQLPLAEPRDEPVPRAAGAPLPAPDRDEAEAARTLERRLRSLMGDRIAGVELTRNRSTILTARPVARHAGYPVVVRIHRCFVEAPAEALEAVAAFAGKRLTRARRRRALGLIREHFDAHTGASEPDLEAPIEPRGLVRDLGQLFRGIAQRHFSAAERETLAKVRIGWGAPLRRCRRRRSVQLGSYCDRSRTIRLHRVLDRPEVPEFVVASIVHHEALHAVLPERLDRAGRRILHGRDFTRRERAFPHFQRSERWIATELFPLLRYLAGGGG